MNTFGFSVMVYDRPSCFDCDAAEQVLTDAGIIFSRRDVMKESEAAEQANAICRSLGREPAVPVIVIHDKGDDRNVHMVFIEPRAEGLDAFAGALAPYRNPRVEGR